MSAAAIASCTYVDRDARAARVRHAIVALSVATIASAFVVILPWWIALALHVVGVAIFVFVIRDAYRRIIAIVVAFFGFVHSTNFERAVFSTTPVVSPSDARVVELVRNEYGDTWIEVMPPSLPGRVTIVERPRISVSRGTQSVAWSDDESRVLLLGAAQHVDEVAGCTDAQHVVGVIDLEAMEPVSVPRWPQPAESSVTALRATKWNAPIVFVAPLHEKYWWTCPREIASGP